MSASSRAWYAINDPTDGRVGGSPFLVGGGDWIGTGHHTVFVDEAGQWWTIYHAVDVNDPYLGVDVFGPGGNLMRRPALLDAIDWVDGWPTVNALEGPTTTPQAAPAAQPGDRTSHHAPKVRPDRPSVQVFADDFSGDALDPAWTWVREPAADTYEVEDGVLRWDTQAGDLFVDSDTPSVLLVDAPQGNWVLDTRVRLSVPAEGCCFNYAQAGIVAYASDDAFVKLVVASIWNTRQTEWAKEVPTAPPSYPRYGNSIVGPPGEWTDLRIVHRTEGGEETYTAYTRAEGGVWEKGMTWTHELGADVQLGLVSMGAAGFTAEFDEVRISRLAR